MRIITGFVFKLRFGNPLVACRLGLAMLLISTMGFASAKDDQKSDFWLRWQEPNVHAIMRHATAPGYGDPENFTLGKCNTQRNLSEAGKQEAINTGAQFAAKGPSPTAVYASQWCRTIDTATLLDLGPVEPLPALNSFFEGRGNGTSQTKQLRAFLAKQDQGAKLFLVTHQVNISALTGEFANSGEVLLFTFEGEQVRVVGRAILGK